MSREREENILKRRTRRRRREERLLKSPRTQDHQHENRTRESSIYPYSRLMDLYRRYRRNKNRDIGEIAHSDIDFAFVRSWRLNALSIGPTAAAIRATTARGNNCAKLRQVTSLLSKYQVTREFKKLSATSPRARRVYLVRLKKQRGGDGREGGSEKEGAKERERTRGSRF